MGSVAHETSTKGMKLEGGNILFVAMVTPLHDDESIDEPGFRKLLQYFIKAHEDAPDLGLLVNPEAGEIFYFAPEEQLRVIAIAKEEVAGKMPIMTGVLGNSTKQLVDVSKAAAKAGVDGLFLMPPIGSMDITIAWDSVRYPEVWADVIGAVAKAVPDKPIVCHPTASPSAMYGIGLPVEPTIAILNRFPQIIGWKMTYNYEGYRKVSRAIRGLDRHVAVLGAAAVNFHENLASGQFDGTVTGSFNYALEPMLEHINAWRAGDIKKACEVWDSGLAELQEYVYEFMGRLHVRYKTATWLRGLIDSPFMRSPMPKPRKEEVQNLFRILAKMNVSLIAETEVEKVVALLE